MPIKLNVLTVKEYAAKLHCPEETRLFSLSAKKKRLWIYAMFYFFEIINYMDLLEDISYTP
jgi:hypothetical protein